MGGCAAALAALAIIAAFVKTVAHNNPAFSLELSDPLVLVGMFIGGSIPFLIASITMTAVGDAAFDMINEIRRQFREIPGLLEGTETIAFFVLLCLLPAWFAPLAWGFGALCLYTAIARVLHARTLFD